MKRKSQYKLYLYLIILSGVILAGTLAATSIEIILGGKGFTEIILKENKTFLVNILRFGHGMMAHGGSEDYGSLINMALKSKFMRYLAVVDKNRKVIDQSDVPAGLVIPNIDKAELEDGRVLIKTEELLFISYHALEIVQDEDHERHHATFRGPIRALPKPNWFIVGLDISKFNEHYQKMMKQTFGVGLAFLLLGILVIVFLGIVQRYELAHLSIEKLNKIKRVLGHFVPHTAKNLIERDPDKKGLLDKYVQDATILFLDIEGFTLLLQQHPQEKINRVIESYFSVFFDVIHKNRGDINETAGDGMMVIFLDEDPVTHARNAIEAAIAIQLKCLEITRREDQDLFPIEVNIGIHSGEVYLGSTKMRGSESERWTFTGSGSVTVLAARLAQYAKHGQVLIGDETARRMETQYPLKSLGRVTLKNLDDSGEVFQLMHRDSDL